MNSINKSNEEKFNEWFALEYPEKMNANGVETHKGFMLLVIKEVAYKAWMASK